LQLRATMADLKAAKVARPPIDRPNYTRPADARSWPWPGRILIGDCWASLARQVLLRRRGSRKPLLRLLSVRGAHRGRRRLGWRHTRPVPARRWQR
jgi:hypothetical protein